MGVFDKVVRFNLPSVENLAMDVNNPLLFETIWEKPYKDYKYYIVQEYNGGIRMTWVPEGIYSCTFRQGDDRYGLNYRFNLDKQTINDFLEYHKDAKDTGWKVKDLEAFKLAVAL